MELVALALCSDSLQFLYCEPAGKQTPADPPLLKLEHCLIWGDICMNGKKWWELTPAMAKAALFYVRLEKKKQIYKHG